MDIINAARNADQPGAVKRFVTETIAARHLCVGNEINGQIVASIARGTKRVSAFSPEKKRIAYLYHDDEIAVGRWVETDESASARARYRRNQMILSTIDRTEVGLQAALDEIKEGVARYGEANSGAIEDLMARQADARVFREVVNVATYDESVTDLVGAVDVFAAEAMREIVRGSVRVSSRSTSVFSNLAEDMRREALARFVESASRYRF